jgi:hypothetical protein
MQNPGSFISPFTAAVLVALGRRLINAETTQIATRADGFREATKCG